ncbi:MAG: biotin transporter BioY [Trueperaceae bacterium]|nr:biotin transporter BioY [Trueperaceae bacterium]
MTSRALSSPLIEEFFPAQGSLSRQLFLIFIGVIFIALFSQFSLSFGPIPVMLQSLIILLTAAIYGARLATLTLFVYVLLGGMGLEVFAGGLSGWRILTGASGGYIFGYLVASTVVGFLAQSGWDRKFNSTVYAMLIGHLLIYLPGLLWLKVSTPSWKTTLELGLLPFISADLIKVLILACLLPFSWKLVDLSKKLF